MTRVWLVLSSPWKMPCRDRWGNDVKRRSLFKVGATAAAVLSVAGLGFLAWIAIMPGWRYRGPLGPLNGEELALSMGLRRDVETLTRVGPRNRDFAGSMGEARRRIEEALVAAGYSPNVLLLDEGDAANVEVTVAGAEPEIVVVGAHYDSADEAPGADDNASGVAALLAIARSFQGEKPRRTVRFVAFAFEEPPQFWTRRMGSLQYARGCRARGDDIVAMLSLESLGYFSEVEGSQTYPIPGMSLLYPSRADFVAFVGNLDSRSLVRTSIGAFRDAVRFPSIGGALPSFVPEAGFSDQWSFWMAGYKGVMVTDTAFFRNPNYHRRTDLPETLDFERLARVTTGLTAVVRRLANDEP